MLESVVVVLGYVQSGALLIPLSIGIWRWKNLSISLRIAWGALLVYFLFFVVSMLYIIRDAGNNLFLNYILSGTFGVLFATCFFIASPTKGWHRWAIGTVAIIGITGLFIEAGIQGRLYQISQWSVALQTVASTLSTLIFFHYLVRTTQISLLAVPLFWICTGRLISTLTSTLYDALSAQMLASSRETLLLWILVQLLITIGCTLLYAIGYWKVSPVYKHHSV